MPRNLNFKPDKITGTLHEDQYTFLVITRPVLLRMRNVSVERCGEQSRRFMCNTFFFSKIVSFMKQCGKKYCTAEQVTNDRIEHAHCMLDT